MYFEREVVGLSNVKDNLLRVIGIYEPYWRKSASEGLSRHPTRTQCWGGGKTSRYKFDVKSEDSVPL